MLSTIQTAMSCITRTDDNDAPESFHGIEHISSSCLSAFVHQKQLRARDRAALPTA